MSLTKKQKKKYIECSSKCPFCGSIDIEGGEVDVDGVIARQQITCNGCQKKWNDIYTLTGIEEEKEYG